MASKRAIMRIQLDGAAKTDLEKLCDRRGMTQVSVMSRLVSWFVQQDDVIQTSVLSTLSDGAMSQLAKQMLKDIAGTDKKIIRK